MSDEKLADRLCEALQYDLTKSLGSAVRTLSPLCESPIEVLFLAAFSTGLEIANLGNFERKGLWKIKHASGELGHADGKIIIIPQYKWENYRIDFALFFFSETPTVFIECDGHEFHERTPEQAERDRKKDRQIQAAGIKVLRFTGREIWRDPIACVIEAINADPRPL